mmetsp:Transcript_62155/g.167605  ORF Transcript_62155/g.167605 Transcript_62155/m.167605 type:complete len:156 (-) Transcript_62155:44-511(-)
MGRTSSSPTGVGHVGDGSYTVKPNQWVPPTDGSLSPKPARGTRGLNPSQAHQSPQVTRLSFWEGDQSHPSTLQRKTSLTKLAARQSPVGAGTAPGAPDAPDAPEAMPSIEASRMEALGATSPDFRWKRNRGMVANLNPRGGFQFMWAQDIPGARR